MAHQHAAVVGAGTMGAGIAYCLAVAGFSTHLVETSAEQASRARDQLRDVACEGERRGRLRDRSAREVLDLITPVREVEEVPEGCALLVESVPERLELKQQVLAAAERRRPRVLSTNTSALSIDELAAAVEDPTAFLGTHFFNPVWSIGLVEVVVGSRTSDETVEATRDVVDALVKQAAVVRDSPGFATSRLDLVASLEAMRMVEQGVASAEDVDRAVTLAYRHPVGPLRLSDIVGLDVRLDIARALATSLGPSFEPPQVLLDLVARGDLGQKSGRGFFTWP